jgi:hypothetical protein
MIISKQAKTVETDKKKTHFNYTYTFYSDGEIEFIVFSDFQLIGKNGGRRGEMDKKQITEEIKEMYREQARTRAGSNIRKLVKENNLYIMWSLTYGLEVENRDAALKDFKKFIQRLNYNLGAKIPYVAVIEVQKKREKRTGKSVLHFHMAIDRYIEKKKLQEIWGHGNVFFTKFKDSKEIVSGDKNSVAFYLSKYLKKDMQDNPNLAGRKMYLCSQGLKRPNKGYGVLTIEDIEEIKRDSKKEYEIAEGIKGYIYDSDNEKEQEKRLKNAN